MLGGAGNGLFPSEEGKLGEANISHQGILHRKGLDLGATSLGLGSFVETGLGLRLDRTFSTERIRNLPQILKQKLNALTHRLEEDSHQRVKGSSEPRLQGLEPGTLHAGTCIPMMDTRCGGVVDWAHFNLGGQGRSVIGRSVDGAAPGRGSVIAGAQVLSQE